MENQRLKRSWSTRSTRLPRILAGPEGHGDEERTRDSHQEAHPGDSSHPRATWESSGRQGSHVGQPWQVPGPQPALTLSRHPVGAGWDVAVAQTHSRTQLCTRDPGDRSPHRRFWSGCLRATPAQQTDWLHSRPTGQGLGRGLTATHTHTDTHTHMHTQTHTHAHTHTHRHTHTQSQETDGFTSG